MKDIFNRASDEWSRARSDANTKKLMADIPEVAAWVDSLTEGLRKPARDLIDRVSRINGIPEADRRSLYQSSIMAFTRLVQRDDIEKLYHVGELSTETAACYIDVLQRLRKHGIRAGRAYAPSK